MATQNPPYQIATFPLPESQLDRFLMRLALGYPGASAERALLQGRDRRDMIADLEPCLQPAELGGLQQRVSEIYVSDALLDYLQQILLYTRMSNEYQNGLSPRAGLALLHSAQAWAFLSGRDKVLPEDIQATLPNVIGHRLRGLHEHSADSLAQSLISSIPVP